VEDLFILVIARSESTVTGRRKVAKLLSASSNEGFLVATVAGVVMLPLCHFAGGIGSQGTVQEVGDLNNSWKSALDVQWDSGSSNRYRLGFDGKVDVHAVVESSSGAVYAEHLPKLCKTHLDFIVGFYCVCYFAPVGLQSIVMSMSVCVSVFLSVCNVKCEYATVPLFVEPVPDDEKMFIVTS